MIEFREESVTDSMRRYINDGFMEYALEKIGWDGTKEQKAFLAYDTGELVAVVVAEHFWGALHIKYVFVKKEYRRQNLGSTLLDHALEFGRKLHCPFAFVETMSFQGLPFYQKLGFTLDFTRSGLKDGLSMHYLSRTL